ncbi:hypothetical protein L6452_43062 [Arctium lappa]|uniref:Uncharacterized protein n=1 Tax=Arctium lappa TaxID=4217 RepID=A0ACB8XJY5_ARCLA|nr:hypothetical protein L6452_43062 [Arctium lappa]
MFNYAHAQLRNVIERVYGVLKARFPILKQMAPFPFQVQKDVVTACFAIHNFIRKCNIQDQLLMEYDDNTMFTAAQEQHEGSNEIEGINSHTHPTAARRHFHLSPVTDLSRRHRRRRIDSPPSNVLQALPTFQFVSITSFRSLLLSVRDYHLYRSKLIDLLLTMGDSETVVAQTSAVEEHPSVPYSASEYGDTSGNASLGTGVATSSDTVDVAASTGTDSMVVDNAIPHADDPGAAGRSEVVDVNLSHEAPSSTAQDVSENPASIANMSVDSSNATAYHSSVNGNDVSDAKTLPAAGVIENGVSSYDAHNSASANQPEDSSVVAALSPEEERLWSIVNANSLDFNAWTALIEETEKTAESNILKIRKVYDGFLAEFPLCYGYWKKYADHEARLGFLDKVVEVYERAVHGVTYSVDMWLHYCVFAINTYGDPDTVRRLFERGLAYVGTDYLSFPLWDKYIEYEYQQQHWSNLAMIYTRILEHPNQQLDRYFNSFRELVASRPLSELRTAEEVAAAANAKGEVNNQENEGEINPNTVEQSSKPVSAGLTEAEELESYMAIREELYKKAKEFDSKIIDFETAIRRPYFHVRPLNVAELENWHNYLDFIEGGDDFNKLSNICRFI